MTFVDNMFLLDFTIHLSVSFAESYSGIFLRERAEYFSFGGDW